ncbi:hypothetical protein ACFVTC_24100 [Streptomyces sp. NPDC057950]|uniref:hypothetical protein n=1 Tax=Streptomyces sp. NPDC057950 TaxID=3346288 RepID=UPI0036EB81AF
MQRSNLQGGCQRFETVRAHQSQDTNKAQVNRCDAGDLAFVPEIVEADVTETDRGESAEPDPPEVVPTEDTAAGPDEDEPGSAGLRALGQPRRTA